MTSKYLQYYRFSESPKGFKMWFVFHWASLPGGSVIKNLPANVGDANSILGFEDPVEKGMATHSSILDWEIPFTEEPGGLQSKRSHFAI